MKLLSVALLALIAVAVGYLAVTHYQERQRQLEYAKYLRNPSAYTAEQWGKRANMECWMYRDAVTVKTNGGSLRPTEFTCITEKAEAWRVIDRPCSDAETDLSYSSPEIASGPPSSESDLFRPLSTVCWSVTKL